MAKAKKTYPKPRSKKSTKKSNKLIQHNNQIIKKLIDQL